MDNSQESIDKSITFMGQSVLLLVMFRSLKLTLVVETLLQKSVDKGRLASDDAQKIKDRVSTFTQLSSLSDSDFVIEAVPVRAPP